LPLGRLSDIIGPVPSVTLDKGLFTFELIIAWIIHTVNIQNKEFVRFLYSILWNTSRNAPSFSIMGTEGADFFTVLELIFSVSS